MGEPQEEGASQAGVSTTTSPEQQGDKRVWTRVVAVSLVCFAIGFAWPKLFGVRFGPSAPGESAQRAPAKGTPSAAAGSPAAAVVVARGDDADPGAVEAPLPSIASSLTVAPSFVLSCTTKTGESLKGGDCGPLAGLDPLVEPGLRRLLACPAARQAVGHLSVVANAHVREGRIEPSLGKSTSLRNANAGQVLSCLRSEFSKVDLSSLSPEHARYTVVFKVDLTESAAGVTSPSPAAPAAVNEDTNAAPAAPATPAAAGAELEVTWEVGVVRASPRDGEIVARLPRGSKVKLVSSQAGWWQIRHGAGYAQQGWLFRGAIGR